jgi:hypothetical protein
MIVKKIYVLFSVLLLTSSVSAFGETSLKEYKSLSIGVFRWEQSQGVVDIFSFRKDKTCSHEIIKPNYYCIVEGRYSLSIDRGKIKWKIKWKTGYSIEDSVRTDYNKNSFDFWYNEYWGEFKNKGTQWLYIGHAAGRSISLLGPYIRQKN